MFVLQTVKIGAAPSPFELFIHTHQKKDKTWMDRRSEHVNVSSKLYNFEYFIYTN